MPVCPMWFDHCVSASDGLSREELILLARTRAERIVEQDARIVELTAANEALGQWLARLEHLLSRNSSNSSSPPSKDDDPGRTPNGASLERVLDVGRTACPTGGDDAMIHIRAWIECVGTRRI